MNRTLKSLFYCNPLLFWMCDSLIFTEAPLRLVEEKNDFCLFSVEELDDCFFAYEH